MLFGILFYGKRYHGRDYVVALCMVVGLTAFVAADANSNPTFNPRAWFISRSIVEPISSAARMAEQVARGDLTGRVQWWASSSWGIERGCERREPAAAPRLPLHGTLISTIFGAMAPKLPLSPARIADECLCLGLRRASR
eukprot:gene36829-48029_t